MSELRDEIAQEFASAATQSDNVQNVDDTAEQTGNAVANADEWLNAPAAYTQERKDGFKDLPQDWRKYLIEREKQVEKGFSDFGNKVNGYKYVDELFNGRQDRLKAAGFNNAKDYIDFLALVDDGMAVNPSATINELKKMYGITDTNVAANGSANDELVARINMQERQLQQLTQALQGDRIKREIDAFTAAKDDDGNLKYPYYNEVWERMGVLMDKGVCKTLEDAYNQSIWANEDIRKKLIEAQAKADLANKTAAAQKAKDAGFTPTSKTTANEEDLPLRELIRAEMEKLG